MRPPCELWAQQQREQSERDAACIMAIVFVFLGFPIDEGGATLRSIHNSTTPELLLRMMQTNVKDKESVVVSVITDGKQETYWTSMRNAEKAFHATMMYHDLIEDVRDRSSN